MSSKEIITILKRLDIPVNNHMSVIDHEAMIKVEAFFKDLKENAAAKKKPSQQTQSEEKNEQVRRSDKSSPQSRKEQSNVKTGRSQNKQPAKDSVKASPKSE